MEGRTPRHSSTPKHLVRMMQSSCVLSRMSLRSGQHAAMLAGRYQQCPHLQSEPLQKRWMEHSLQTTDMEEEMAAVLAPTFSFTGKKVAREQHAAVYGPTCGVPSSSPSTSYSEPFSETSHSQLFDRADFAGPYCKPDLRLKCSFLNYF